MNQDKIKEGFDKWWQDITAKNDRVVPDFIEPEELWLACAEWMMSQASDDFKGALNAINVYDGYDKAMLEMWQAAKLSSMKELAEKDVRIKELESELYRINQFRITKAYCDDSDFPLAAELAKKENL